MGFQGLTMQMSREANGFLMEERVYFTMCFTSFEELEALFFFFMR